MLASSVPIADIARRLELTRQTIYRIKADPDAAAASLATWDEADKKRKQD